jgi:hypothetical protein
MVGGTGGRTANRYGAAAGVLADVGCATARVGFTVTLGARQRRTHWRARYARFMSIPLGMIAFLAYAIVKLGPSVGYFIN